MVQSVERALSILEQLARGPAGVSQLAAATDLPKSTVARLLATLEAAGAVDRPPASTDYRLGPAMAALASSALPERSLITVADPHLRDLAASVGEVAGLSVADGYHVHYVAQTESADAVQVRDWTNSRAPMHLVPSGIVFMAHWPPAELDRYLGRDLEATTPRSVTDGAAIRAKLATALEAGYVAGFEEFADGLNSVAAPLLNSDGVPEAAVHVHGPAYRFPADGDPAAVGEMLVATCARIAGQLELVT